MKIDPESDALLLGLDPRFNFFKSCLATIFHLYKKKMLVVSEEKSVYVDNFKMPGTMALMKSVCDTFSKKKEDIFEEALVKGNMDFIEKMAEQFAVEKEKALAVSNGRNELKKWKEIGV